MPPSEVGNPDPATIDPTDSAPGLTATSDALSHYSPTDLPDSQWLDAIAKHYSGKVTVARDGQVFAL